MIVGFLQHNYTVGACFDNASKIIRGYERLVDMGAQIVVSSELAVLGYPPNDLLERADVLHAQRQAIDMIADKVGLVPLVIGVAKPNTDMGKSLFNSAIVLRKGRIVHQTDKCLLPTYDVFDESRYFEPGSDSQKVFEFGGKKIGILVCEDVWGATRNSRGEYLYKDDPINHLYGEKPHLVLVLNASPYYWGKAAHRLELVSKIATALKCPLVYVNQVGGNDSLIFDGRSFMLNGKGEVIDAGKAYVEDEFVVDTDASVKPWLYHSDLSGERLLSFDSKDLGSLYDALVLGVRDYCQKTGFKQVIVAESGGIDSALVTAIAADAIGPENVAAIRIPSDFSSKGSLDDAEALCRNLGVAMLTCPIGPLYDAVGRAMEKIMVWKKPEEFGKDVSQENVQARLRGLIVMTLSNRNGYLVLTTGNKSELAVGYCTLYGDMCGGLAVISDVPKTVVFALARYRNRSGIVIPQTIIEKPPSAELRPGQKDQDSLPPYSVLDDILGMYIEEGQSIEQIIESGFEKETVLKVTQMVDRNEYKRQQAAPGLKVTSKSFGSGRRFPIAARIELR